MNAFPWPLILASLPFLTSMGFTPGPNNILVASSGVNYGFRATLPHILGVTVGYPAMMFIVGLGLARVFIALPQTHLVLKYVCIVYLLYLAWRIAMATALSGSQKIARPLTFMQAAAFQWVNGKGWVVALSAVTTYTAVNSTLLLQIIALSAISVVISFASVCTWTLFGAMLRRYLHTERRRRGFNYTMAGLLVASIIPVFWE